MFCDFFLSPYILQIHIKILVTYIKNFLQNDEDKRRVDGGIDKIVLPKYC